MQTKIVQSGQLSKAKNRNPSSEYLVADNSGGVMIKVNNQLF
jgi:hypothetical protein